MARKLCDNKQRQIIQEILGPGASLYGCSIRTNPDNTTTIYISCKNEQIEVSLEQLKKQVNLVFNATELYLNGTQYLL